VLPLAYVNFAELKQRISIEKTVELLGLTIKQSGATFRGPCPACGSGGDRSLVVTPAKGVWYCWAAHVGGDQIALTAHIRKCEPKDAAAWLDGGTVPSQKEMSGEPVSLNRDSSGLKPLELEHEHPAVEALGFSPDDAKALGIGYAPRGIMRGLVVVPVRLEDGKLAGYVGVEEIAKLPPRWHGLPENKVVPLKRA
jgi:DNA primase